MLVITRKQEETIRIGSDVVVKVLSAQGNRVRLGISAPQSVKVMRGELPVEGGEHSPGTGGQTE